MMNLFSIFFIAGKIGYEIGDFIGGLLFDRQKVIFEGLLNRLVFIRKTSGLFRDFVKFFGCKQLLG